MLRRAVVFSTLVGIGIVACSDDEEGNPASGSSATTDAGGGRGGAGGAVSTGGQGPGVGGSFGVGGSTLEPWILSIDNQMDNEVHQLVQISVDAPTLGTTREICADVALPDELPAQNIISSLTFNGGQLYASGRKVDEGDTLLLVDPCECTATEVGAYGYTFVAGITSNGAADMFGISTSEDVFFAIDPTTAIGSLLAALDADFQTVGLTWSGAELDTLWGIDGANDRLLEFSSSGIQIDSKDLDYDFGSVGMEYHPGLDALYACSNSGELLIVDVDTGLVTVGPDMGIADCNNLAAPFGTVACVPNVR